MGEFWGADTKELQDLWLYYEQRADRMEDDLRNLEIAMMAHRSTHWRGPDADAYFAEWDRVYNYAREVCEKIEVLGRRLREEGEEQDDASAKDDGFLDTLKDIGRTLTFGWNILEKTAKAMAEGLKKGYIDWPALREGGGRLAQWLENSNLEQKLGKLLNSKGVKGVGKFIPIIDIPLTIDSILEADDPVEIVLAWGGLVGNIPHPGTVIAGLAIDGLSLADWASEEFFDYDLSREAGDWFMDANNDRFDQKRWNPMLA